MKRLDPTLQADQNLQKLLNRIDEVSTLPHVMMQVTAVTSNPLSSVEDLTRVVETDPALATRLLRRVNSAKYGLS
ncbi:MAG: HDOD domain-containing protein, partial [Phycisphaeraceae bacterium]|nr:HDOD domain-containing protein [Phycisphaeraceae bacterium]